MRFVSFLAVMMLASALSCGRDDTATGGASGSSSSAAAPAPESQRPPAGDPATLPKVPADADKIRAMLRERFGEATARTIRVEVENRPQGLRVGLTGEVPNEQIRVAVMKEVETRVENIKFQDFNLDLAGPVRMLLNLDARLVPGESTCWAPDLSYAVTTKGYVYELATGRRVNRIHFSAPTTRLQYMALSPDGKTLAAAFVSGEIALFDMPLGRNRRTIQPESEPTDFDRPVCLAFSPDSKQLISVNRKSGDLRLWDLAKGSSKQLGSHIQPNQSHQLGDNYHIAMSPDMKMIATVVDLGLELFLWSVESRAKLPMPQIDRLAAKALTWSHDGRTVAVGRSTDDRRGALLYDVAAKTFRIFATERDELISGMAFSPDDKTLAVSYESVSAPLRLWDVASGKVWQTLDEKRASQVESPAFSANGAVLAVDCNGLRPPSIRLFDVSRRPGAASNASPSIPPPLAGIETADDELATQLADAIRRNFDPRNIETLEVTIAPDGTIKLSGKVSDDEVKRVAGRTAEVHRTSEDVGPRPLNKVINELQVTGRYGNDFVPQAPRGRNRGRSDPAPTPTPR